MKTVVVVVRGGSVQHTECPRGVAVRVLDYDVMDQAGKPEESVWEGEERVESRLLKAAKALIEKIDHAGFSKTCFEGTGILEAVEEAERFQANESYSGGPSGSSQFRSCLFDCSVRSKIKTEEREGKVFGSKRFPHWQVQLVREIRGTYDQLTGPKQIVEYLAFLRRETVETFHVVFLNTRNCIVGVQEICRGSVEQVQVMPRETFQAAIVANCTSIILVHSHPSGDPEPSPEDRDITLRLKEAGELLGIKILDHIIVGEPGYYSFLEKGDL